MKFTERNNVQGFIIRASMKDLLTGKKYGLKEKRERSGGKSHNLFFKPINIEVNGDIFIFKFRVDFNDKRIKVAKDPFLDLEIYTFLESKISIEKYLNIHNTEKEEKNNLWLYDLSDKKIEVSGNIIPINFSFILEVTKQQSICAKARIRKAN